MIPKAYFSFDILKFYVSQQNKNYLRDEYYKLPEKVIQESKQDIQFKGKKCQHK